jgi:hypothetical protein
MVTTLAVRRGVLVICSFLLSGCLVPSEPAKQAEEIASISAEGALLAHEVGEGDVTGTFARVHAEGLRRKLSELDPNVQVDALAELLRNADAGLALLEDGSVDAGPVEQRLEGIAKQADKLAK